MRIFSIILVSLLASNSALGAKVVIENDSDWDIHYLYLSPTASDDWGPDQLGENIIRSGSRYTLRGVDCNTYDVKIVDEDADECILTDLAMCIFKEHWQIDNDSLLNCQGRTRGESGADSVSMTLYNASKWDIYELYISPSSQAMWGDDILGNDTWDSGESVDLWNIECGNYDIRMVDEDEDVCQLDEVFLCGNEGAVTLTDDALLECQANY